MSHPPLLRPLAAALVVLVACAKGDAEPRRHAAIMRQPVPSTAPTAISASDIVAARNELAQMYATFFSRGQDMPLEDQERWYTPELTALMHQDAEGGAAQCGVGFLNFVPLTSAQDNVAGYTLGTARGDGDSVLVPARIHNDYPPPQGANEEMIVVMRRASGGWRIGNFRHSDWDVVSGLRKSVAELMAAPKADCGDSVKDHVEKAAPSTD